MQPIEFHKEYAQYLLDCLANGLPIHPPPGGGWRRFDQLMLAGAAFFAYCSHGPMLEQPDLTPEQQAENDGLFGEEVMGTINFLAQVFESVKYDEYDEQWEPTMTALVAAGPNNVKVQPVKGWKVAGGGQ